jgi:hypothetical protein
MAPEDCVTLMHSVSPEYVVLVGRDLAGQVRVKVELSRADASEWWVETIRHWLADQYGAPELRLLR